MKARGTHGDAGMKEPRKSAPSKSQPKTEEKLDEELEESFPASDPPSNTPTSAGGPSAKLRGAPSPYYFLRPFAPMVCQLVARSNASAAR